MNNLQTLLNVLPFYETTMAKWLTQFYDDDIKKIEEIARTEFDWAKGAGTELGKVKKEAEPKIRKEEPEEIEKPEVAKEPEKAEPIIPKKEPEETEKEEPKKKPEDEPEKIAPHDTDKDTEDTNDTPPELDDETSQQYISVIKEVGKILMKKYNADGFNLVLNNGKVAGQIIEHVHFHILPRKKGDNKSEILIG